MPGKGPDAVKRVANDCKVRSGDLVLVQNTRRKKGENLKLQPKFVGPYKGVATFENPTYQLKRLGHSTNQNECCLKLYHACAENRGQTPGIQKCKGCKKPGRTVKTRAQPPMHQRKYIESYYPQPKKEQCTYQRLHLFLWLVLTTM